MATKTIKTTVTLHTPHPSAFTPFVYDGMGSRIGNYAIVDVPPGSPATLDAAEADAILARFGGEEVKTEEQAEKQSRAKS